VRRGQSGASNLDSPCEKETGSSDEETEIDDSEDSDLDITIESASVLSERAHKTLDQTSALSQNYFTSASPFLLRMSKKQKKSTYCIELQTFARSKNLVVCEGSKNKVLFLIQFHPLEESTPTLRKLSELVEDLYVMASHRHDLKNKNKISGRMSGIGFRGAYEDGKTAG
jgi:hypothetical protein